MIAIIIYSNMYRVLAVHKLEGSRVIHENMSTDHIFKHVNACNLTV